MITLFALLMTDSEKTDPSLFFYTFLIDMLIFLPLLVIWFSK